MLQKTSSPPASSKLRSGETRETLTPSSSSSRSRTPAKLTSLEDFFPVGPSRLRGLLIEHACTKFSEPNEVLPRWWQIIGSDEQISFLDLIDYYLALSDLDGRALRDRAALEINRLGLLPDPAFFNKPTKVQLRKRLRDNRAIALRLANFSEEDRQRVGKVLSEESDAEQRTHLRHLLRRLQDYRRGGPLSLTASDARQLLNIRRQRPKPPKPKPDPDPDNRRQVPRTLTGLAVESLLNDEDTDNAVADMCPDEAMTQVRAQLENINESTIRPVPVSVTLPDGLQVDHQVSTAVINMVNRLIGDDSYGGLVSSHGEDIDTMVQGFQHSAKVLRRFERLTIDRFLEAFAEAVPGRPILKAFNNYDNARTALLPYLGELHAAPLLVATAPTTRNLVTNVVSAYRELITVTSAAYRELHTEFGDDARYFVELLLLLDTVFLDNGSTLVALLTPLHPMLLWHYSEYVRVLTTQKDLLTARDRTLVRSELDQSGVPYFFSSIGIPRAISNRGINSIPFSGRLGDLPHFSVQATARDPKDGTRVIRKLIEAFVDLHPAASEGFRLVLLDPVDAGIFLSMCCDLADTGRLRGAHVTVLRRSNALRTELNLSSDEERRIQHRFGDHTQRRFTFETKRIPSNVVGPLDDSRAHICVAFDLTERETASAGAPVQEIQPLVNRRRIIYRISTNSLDMEPGLGGILAEYNSLATLAIGTDVNSYATMHQGAALKESFRAAVQLVPWYVIADSHIDRDLQLMALRILTEREGTRDMAAFSRSPAAFRRGLRDVVRQFNTYVTDDKLDVLLEELSDLLDAGILSLRPNRSGEVTQSHVRGLLGLLVAVQALRDLTPDGYDRVLLSLDSTQARRWLHLGDDPRRADLLVIDAADDRFIVTVVEVKTRTDTAREYQISGNNVTGRAVDQLLSTYRLIRQILDLSDADLLVTPSRREILRGHLYRELCKARYNSITKQRWAKRSGRLFDGEPEVDLRCALVEMHLGYSRGSLSPLRTVYAIDDNRCVPVDIIDLNEDGVESVKSALTPDQGPDGTVHRQQANNDDNVFAPTARESYPLSSKEHKPDLGSARNDSTTGGTSRPRVMIGHRMPGSGAARQVWFDPHNPEQSLNNPHISISGETGSGKTQATKALVHELLPQGLPALVLDFKDDYSKRDYAGPEGLVVHDANIDSLPFNPMVPPIDRESGLVNPISHVHQLTNMIQRIYRLGDQQAFTLREAMKETYTIAGIDGRSFLPTEGQHYLPFDAVRDVLVRENATPLLGRLSPIFDLGLFSSGADATNLDEFLRTPTVIRISQLPGDRVKDAVAEFFLMAVYNYLIRREHRHRLERLLVLDEAWRLVKSPFLEPLMREGRAFGLGVIVATQFPRDLPDQIAGSTGTRLIFNQTKAEQVREIQRTLIGKTSGAEADHLGSIVRGLASMDCIIQSLHHRPWVKLRVIPHYVRAAKQ